MLVVGCAKPEPPRAPRASRPEVQGSTMFLNLQPTNHPEIVGSYDFELLGQGFGRGCVDRGGDTVYWSGMTDLAQLSSDALTRQAIAAAMHDAVTRLDRADTILVTRVVTDSKGPDRICANLVGRGVRLMKTVSKNQPPVLEEDAKLHSE